MWPLITRLTDYYEDIPPFNSKSYKRQEHEVRTLMIKKYIILEALVRRQISWSWTRYMAMSNTRRFLAWPGERRWDTMEAILSVQSVIIPWDYARTRIKNPLVLGRPENTSTDWHYRLWSLPIPSDFYKILYQWILRFYRRKSHSSTGK